MFLRGLAISPTAVFGGVGLALIPGDLGEAKWVNLGGPGDVSYLKSLYVPGIAFRYTTPEGARKELVIGQPDPDGNFRDPDGRVIARWVRIAGKLGIVVSTAALLHSDSRDPRLCPAASDDRHGLNGREYEEFMKPLFNPGNRTPPDMGYAFFRPGSAQPVKFDDCQQKTGMLAEYKGPGFESHMQKGDLIWQQKMFPDMIGQAEKEEEASEARPVVWFFAEKSVADRMRTTFRNAGLNIRVIWFPMPKPRSRR